MTAKSLFQPRLQPHKTLRAVAIGLAIAFAAPVFADNLPEVQRLIKQGQLPQALEKVDAFLGNKPKDAQGRFLKGLIFTEMNKPTEAISIFTKLTEDYPELPEPYNNLAVLYAQQKQYDKARTSLEMAIRTHPSYAIAYENLGDIYAKLASQAYDKALQLDNANPATQNKLALIRDLITTSSKGSKPAPPATAATQATVAPPAVAAPVAAPATVAVAKPASPAIPQPAIAPPVAALPTASVLTTTQGAASLAPAKVAEAKPVTEKHDGSSEDVAKYITAWAGAWSRKDMKAYFSAYASDFTPPNGLSRKAWETQREDRIADKSGKISVTVDEPQITFNGNKATARFRQHYSAPGMTSTMMKTLVLTHSGNKWLIKEENSR